MNNNSRSNRIVKITAKTLVVLLAVCMSFSALPLLTSDVLPKADAAEVEYLVPAGASIKDINTQLKTYSSGSIVNVTLGGDINYSFEKREYDTEIVGIVIPEDITVNLYMNGKKIYFNHDGMEKGAWKLPGCYAIDNYGELNIFSGSGPDSQNLSEQNFEKSAIVMKNKSDNMESNQKLECAYSVLTCVRNAGKLYIGKNVSLSINNSLHYSKGKEASATVSAVGVYNVNISAFVKLQDASIKLYCNSQGKTTKNRRGHTNIYMYGIYGGNILIHGNTKINLESKGYSTTDTKRRSKQTARQNHIVYGIATTTGDVKMFGGSIDVTSHADNNDACYNGYQRVYMGGIITNDGNKPIVGDGNIILHLGYNHYTDVYETQSGNGPRVTNKTTVASSKQIPETPEYYIKNAGLMNGEYREPELDFPKNEIKKSQFLDEYGNPYDTDGIISDTNESDRDSISKSLPTAINRGALGDTTFRVHVVYRYWLDTDKTEIDSSMCGTTNHAGYSYVPMGDGTNVVAEEADFFGFYGTNKTLKNKESEIRYIGGGQPSNNYYWKLDSLAYAQANEWFSDYDVRARKNVGTVFKNWLSHGATETGAGKGIAGPIYIFVDYVKIAPTSIKASAGINGTAKTTYTGNSINASALNLKILDSVSGNDFTSEYNIDFNDNSKIPVNFTYTGETAAGVQIDQQTKGNLPKDAGTYQVSMHIDDSKEYGQDPDLFKNRYALDYSFTLVIEKASVKRGNLPAEITLKYGQKLKDVLTLSNFKAIGVENEGNIEGIFAFANSSESTSYKDVGTGTINVIWSPTYSQTAQVKNYKNTEFTISYTVNKATLRILPNAANIEYGESVFKKPFSLTVSGLVGNDNNDTVLTKITDSMSFMIKKNEEFVPYVPGEVFAGTYPIRATFKATPDCLKNYEYEIIYDTDNNPNGNLTVDKRGLIIEASALERDYDPENIKAIVSFTITDGIFGVDDIRINSFEYILNNNKAGSREVNDVTKTSVENLLTGGARNNYFVEKLTYDTGEKLLALIRKGTPDATTPIVSEMYYTLSRTLADINLDGSTSSVTGSWQWIDKTINPTVAVGTYKAIFVPNDLENYDTKEVDIPINIKPTPVEISYEGNVEYGDTIPNITAYSYTADLDPSFDINKITTTGNITPHTTYQQGLHSVEGGYPVEIFAPNFKDVDGNYIFSTKNGVINVLPKKIIFNVDDKTIAYGDNFVASSATVNVSFDEKQLVGNDKINDITYTGSAPSFSFETDFRYVDNYAVGNYYIKATPIFNTTSDYKVEVKEGTLKVSKADLTIIGNQITLDYNSDIPADIDKAFTVIGAKRNEGIEQIVSSGNIKIDTGYTKGSSVNEAGYSLNVDISHATFNNYNVKVENGLINVVKATPVITEYPTASIIYTESLADAIFEGGKIKDNVAGKYIYNAGATIPAYKDSPYTIYSATFIPDDTVNYNSISGLYIPLTVNKKEIAGTLTVTGIPMIGQILTVDVSGLDPNDSGIYSFQWKADDTVLGTGTTLNLANYNLKGKKITVTATATGYYKGTVTFETTTISPELTNIETILEEGEWNKYFVIEGLGHYKGDNETQYDASQKVVQITRTPQSSSSVATGEITVKYNGSTKIPVNAGVYNVTIDVSTPTDIDFGNITTKENISYDSTHNVYVYSPVSNYYIGTLIITPAPYNVYITVDNKIYDGYTSAVPAKIDESGAFTLIDGTKDDVEFDKNSAVFFFEDANVGTEKTVYCSDERLIGTSAKNYELKLALTNGAKANITARTLDVKVVPVTREYKENNYNIDLSFETDIDTLAPADNLNSVYINEALVSGIVDDFHAGTRKVTIKDAELTGEKADNYILKLVNTEGLSVKIEKAVPDYPLPNTDVLYYDSARHLSEISLGDSRWQWDISVANTIPSAGTHIYKAIFTPTDTENFAEVEYEVPVDINKTIVTVTAASFNVVYGDLEPTYYCEIDGLTGSDTIKDNVSGYVLMTCSYVPGSDVNTYPIVLNGAYESENYSFKYVNGTITVVKRPVYTESIAENREYIPGNLNVNVSFTKLSNIFEADKNNVYLDGQFPITGTVETDVAGKKTVSYTLPTLAGSKAENYDLKILNNILEVEITKAKLPGIILPATAEIGFGQKLSEAKFTSPFDAKGLGKIELKDSTSIPEKVGTFTDKYWVVFTPFDTLNYETVEKYITLTVKTSELNISISISGTAQVGKKLYVSVANIPASALDYINYTWYRVDDPNAAPSTGTIVAEGTDNYKLTESDKGHYIICVAENINSSPYIFNEKAVFDSVVTEEKLSFWQKLIRWLYKLVSIITSIRWRVG